MTIKYPKRLKLARTPTPLEFMPQLTDHFGGPNIWFKRDDLTGSTLSGNKIRKLEFSLADAFAQRTQVVITAGGIQSNHCRATALCCARLGLECHLILRGEQKGAPDGNLLLDSMAGARISYFPQEIYSTKKPEIVADLTAKYASEGKKAYWIPVGASNAIGSWGYVRAFAELMAQTRKMGIRIDHLVAAVGSGGTNAGLIAGKALTKAFRPEIWGVNVCDDAPTFETEIRAILNSMSAQFGIKLTENNSPIRILDGYVGKGYAIPYEEELALLKWCGANEGQILDPVYTGKALYGLAQEIKQGRFRKKDNIVFIHTGGMFGLFPARDILFPEPK